MKLLFVMVIALSLFQGINPDVDELFQEAEIAYAKGDFQEAIKVYQQMIDAGAQNAEIYFNLGNAYYQLHDLGRALVNYRRAEQFIPRDEDLQLNIARVLAQRVDAPSNFVAIGDQIAHWESSWLSIAEMGLVVLMLWWITCGFLSAYLLLKRWREWTRWGAIISGVLFVFIGAVSSIRVVVDHTYPLAVVVNSRVSVLTGPDTQYMAIFELHTAGEVRIMEQRNGWIRVQLPDLQEGWIKADSVEVI